MKRLGSACSALGLLLVAGVAWGQAAQVTTDVGPHYVGEAVSIRVTAVGFEEDPVPEAEVAPPRDGRLELQGVSPSVSQSITIVNGKMTRTREVTHVFQFAFTPARAGTAQLGPFRIRQAGREARVPVVRLKVQDVPSNDDVRVRLELPPGPFVVGERVPVTVSFVLERTLQKNALGYTLRVPFFDEQSSFRFLDEGPSDGDTNVVIDTGTRQLELRGHSTEHSEGNKRFTTVRVTRTLVPLAAGRHAVPGVSFSVEEGVRFRRDFFGGRRATQVRRWRAQGPGRAIEVESIPGREQPPSFAGAIGRGFSLEVSADRTVVQVGDPITLTLVVRGEGLETVSLPALDAEGLLPAGRFRVPEDPPPGERTDDAKRFTATVRVLDDSVTEIPGLAYSWFDPDTRSFETTRSRPIALSVRSAEVIGAGDVQVSTREDDEADELAVAGDETAGTPARARSFALTGADLAVTTDSDRVLGAGASWAGAWLVPSVYAGSLALVGAAWLDRRRRRVDPEEQRRRRALAGELARVRGAAEKDPSEGAREIAGALRAMLRELPDESGPELDRLLGECDALGYAPGGSGARLEPELVERAIRLAESLNDAARRPRRGGA